MDLTLIPKIIWRNELVLVLVVPQIRITQSTASVMSRTPIGNEIRKNSRLGFNPSQRTRECIAEKRTNDLSKKGRRRTSVPAEQNEEINQVRMGLPSAPLTAARARTTTGGGACPGSWPYPGGVRGEAQKSRAAGGEATGEE